MSRVFIWGDAHAYVDPSLSFSRSVVSVLRGSLTGTTITHVRGKPYFLPCWYTWSVLPLKDVVLLLYSRLCVYGFSKWFITRQFQLMNLGKETTAFPHRNLHSTLLGQGIVEWGKGDFQRKRVTSNIPMEYYYTGSAWYYYCWRMILFMPQAEQPFHLNKGSSTHSFSQSYYQCLSTQMVG